MPIQKFTVPLFCKPPLHSRRLQWGLPGAFSSPRCHSFFFQTQCAWGESTHPASLRNVSRTTMAQRSSEEKANHKTFYSYQVTVRTRYPAWECPEGAALSESYTGCLGNQLHKLPGWNTLSNEQRRFTGTQQSFWQNKMYLAMLQHEHTYFLWSGHFFKIIQPIFWDILWNFKRS